jgi:MFS family permease
LTEPHPTAANPQRFYGWVIVATCFVQLSFAAGLGFYGLPLYLKTLNTQRGFSVFSLSIATALFWVSVGVTGVIVARLIAKIDPRFVIAVGGLVGGFAVALIGRAEQFWLVTLLYMLFGAGFTCTAVLVANTVVTRWFHQKRSIALSISATGLSVGGIVFTPVAARLLKNETLPDAMLKIGVVFFVGTTLLSVLLLRPFPSSKGQFPDGLTPRNVSAGPQVVPGWDFNQAKADRAFWAITATFTFALLGQVGGISQLVKLASERAGEPTNSQVISVLAACSVIGRLSGGLIVTKIESRTFAYVALAMQGLGLCILSFVQSPAMILVGAGLFGLGVGNVLLLHPLLLAEAYGVKDYARLYGRSSIFISAGNAVGPLSMGFARDHLGGYTTSYLIATAMTLLGLTVYAMAGTPPAESAS